MTVSSSTNRVSYSGNGSTTVFAYTFKVFDQDDLTVIIRSADGTETVKTITTDYTVSGVGNDGGGNVTFNTAPASGETVVVLREQGLVQELDLVPNDPFPAEVLESALDKLTFMVQQHEETLGRTIKASRTNTITGAEFTISAVNRANKIFAFDSAGDVSITQELGTYRGNWATATAFAQRDIVKDTSNNNIYICLVAHTSSGSQPISSNADVAKWALLVDAASATTSASAAASSASAAATSATAAAGSATAAAGSATAAASSATDAETAQTAAETAQTAAETAQAAAEAVYDSFDDRYLGAKSSDPTLDNDGNALIDGALYFDTTNNAMKVYDLGTTTWLRTTPTSSDQANINTVSGISANVTTVAGISADVTAVAAVDTDVTAVAAITSDVTAVAAVDTDVTAVAGVASSVTTVAGISANVTTVAGISANVTTVAGISADVTAVAAVDTDVTAVAAITSDVTAVAAVDTDVTAVAGVASSVTTVAGISADVTTVAGIPANVSTVAGISADVVTVANSAANISTVATDIANVNSVAGSITNVNTVATNIADVNSFANTYRIAATDPVDSLDEGDLVFNTTDNKMKVYNGSAWQDVAPVATSLTVSQISDLTATASEINVLDGVTATTVELNILDGVTATTAELNILDGVTATTAELNILDGVTATAAELNYLDITTVGVSQASKVITTDASNNTNIGGTVTAGFFSGDGSNLTNLPATAPTTTQVLNATAGASHGAVGTYAFLGRRTSGSISAGGTFAGSDLIFAAIDHGRDFINQQGVTTNNSRGGGGSPSGTWRAMGGSSFTTGFLGTLFLRIS